MLQKCGFILVYKNTIVHIENGKQIVKGNVDAELVLHAAAIEYPKYDRAVIVTNDGDFTCLIKYLIEEDRLLRIITPNNKFSSLFKPYIKNITTMNKLRGVVEKK
jgi:uncharacterized LabA/DUF88 family protein